MINTMQKYHSQLGIPKNVQTRFGQILLEYSQHALEESQKDRYGRIRNLPKSLDTQQATIVEVVVQNGKTVKAVYETPYTKLHKLSLVILPANRKVVTLWLSEISDKHQTLNESAYCIPDEEEL